MLTVLIPPTDKVQDWKIFNSLLFSPPIQFKLNLNTNTEHVKSLIVDQHTSKINVQRNQKINFIEQQYILYAHYLQS